MVAFKVDTVSRVQAALEIEGPNRQILRISVADDMSQVQVMGLPDFPDERVSNGTRVYQVFQDMIIFEICILRG